MMSSASDAAAAVGTVEEDAQQSVSVGGGAGGGRWDAEVVELDVGGLVYVTTRATLLKYPDSMLGAMFGSDMNPTHLVNKKGQYFVDRDGVTFKYLLDFLRSNTLSLPKDYDNFELLRAEADYYQVQPFIDAVMRVQKEQLVRSLPQVIPADFIEIHTIHEKRFSGSNLRNTDGTTAHFAVETIHLVVCGKTQYIDEYMRIQMMKGSNPLGEGEEYFIDADPAKLTSTLIFKKYNQYNMTKFRHIHQEHRGVITNLKLCITGHLSRNGWALADTSSTSGTFQNREVNSDIFCCEYRERWVKHFLTSCGL